MRLSLKLVSLGFLLSLAACCSVGPDYKRPTAETPTQWKEAATPSGTWKQGVPQDAIAKGSWWEIFHDPVLNDLEREATTYNQNLQAAVARVVEARAQARVSAAQFYPNISLDPTAEELHYNSHELYPPSSPASSYSGTTYQVPLDLSYEIDLWGRIRRSFQASRAAAQASVADYENILLTLKADVAQDYFSLRALDTEADLLYSTVTLRQKALDLTQVRFKGGASSELDVAQAQTELESVRAQALDIGIQRSKLEHALAVLVGKPPSAVKILPLPLAPDATPPVIPTGLPADLLERRPDVAEAERLMAERNAQIGVAKAAFFPVLRLTGDFGVESKDISNLFTWGSRSWGLGPSLSIPLLDGGVNSAYLKQARATYQEATANYRQQVLTAFQDVEDGLSSLRILAQEAEVDNRTVQAAQIAAKISEDRYNQGLVNYLQIVDAERTLLDNQRLATQLQGQRFVTAVMLIKALGGGWDENTLIPKQLPKVNASIIGSLTPSSPRLQVADIPASDSADQARN